MKTEEDTATSIDFFPAKDLPRIHEINCIQGNEAVDYCTNSDCPQEQIFRCSLKNCQCRDDHKECLKADLDSTLHKIQSKINDTTEVRQKVYDLFDKLIDQLSQIRDNLLIELEHKIKYNNLHDIQKEFLQAMSTGQEIKFTSKQSALLWEVVNKQYLPKFYIWQQIQGKLNELKSKNSTVQQSISEILSTQELIEIPKEVLKSSILKEGYLADRLFKMHKRKICSMQLLFKASDQDFSLSKYYELCGKETNTMIICKTNKDKIIGGYTPLSFNPDPEYKGELINGNFYSVADETLSSMLFSLSENDKFELVDSAKAILHLPLKKYLTFGNTQLVFCDKSDQNFCQSFLGNQQFKSRYFNSKYKDNKESYLKFNGNETKYFCTKEWEVWKISLV